MPTVGMLTGGGDAPALNAVIRAAVRRAENGGWKCLGILDGWKGLLDGETMPLGRANTNDIIAEGGTILGTSRTNPYKKPEDVKKLLATWKKLGLDALIAIGGDDTLGVADRLFREHKVKVVGVPKTIDNDLSCTDYTFGFDTAVNAAMVAIDHLITTARSHRRCFVVETMGRHAGWIAAYAGIAGGADITLVPEKPVDMEQVIAVLKRNRKEGRTYNIVVVSEGITFEPGAYVTVKEGELDEFGHVRLGGVGNLVAEVIEKHTGYETRCVVLGHLQRGGPPTAFDRVLATRLGYAAAELVVTGQFGKMAALRGNTIVAADLAEAVGETKTLDMELFKVAEAFFTVD